MNFAIILVFGYLLRDIDRQDRIWRVNYVAYRICTNLMSIIFLNFITFSLIYIFYQNKHFKLAITYFIDNINSILISQVGLRILRFRLLYQNVH